MTTLGVLHGGQMVRFKDARERFGVLAELVVGEDEEWTPMDITVGATRLITHMELCRRVAFYDANVGVYVPYKSRWGLFRGTFLHKPLFSKMSFKEMELSVALGDGIKAGGIIDGYQKETGMVWDIKSTKWMPPEAKSTHLTQLSIYGWLLKEHGLPANFARVLYLTFDDWEYYTVPMKDLKQWTREEMKSLIQDYLSCKMDIKSCGAGPIETWKCGYCNYVRYCQAGLNNIKSIVPSKRKNLSAPGCMTDDVPISIEDLARMTFVRPIEEILASEEKRLGVKDGIYCPSCKNLIGVVPGADRTFETLKCQCGALWSNPRVAARGQGDGDAV